MMASSSSSSDLSAADHHHLILQGDLPWRPPSSSLPLAPALQHAIGGTHQQWNQPLILDQLSPDELELLLQSAQAQLHHNHSHSHLPAAASPLTAAVAPHQLSSLLMMQELGFQWSSAVTETTADTSSSSQQHQDAVLKDDDQEEAPKLASVGSLINSCRHRSSPMTVDYNDIVVDHGGGGAVVLPSFNVSLMQKPCPVVGGEAFEMLCKSGQLAMMPTSGTRLLGSEHMAYDYGPPAHHHRLLQGPSSSYKMGTVPAALLSGNGNVSSCHDEQQLQLAAAVSSISSKKKSTRLRPSTTIIPSFKVRKEKLGDRIAALQQLVSPFGKTDTASVLMEAIGYINFLQDQVETLSGPYMKSSKHKKARTTQQRGPSNTGDQKEEAKLDLRSRGLCLVPLSCTSYVTNENGVWAPPNFRGN
ncbi:hypothetical protein BRADI_2g03427v3 [Brachypodium distachyon]|uniref:BHLH domain-containing protein n=1 Tax=Brachypodium distachyon TaxID=15368 RepID=I1HC34_BRADI|nr:hypothetical protein BRADI_2g03427v3 [Brachypodium distachyon]